MIALLAIAIPLAYVAIGVVVYTRTHRWPEDDRELAGMFWPFVPFVALAMKGDRDIAEWRRARRERDRLPKAQVRR